MQYDDSVLTRTERRIFALRTLYSRAGYRSYRMRKFEDYDLYSRNKDFLLSDRVITFTDTNGRLKALKPDVTLSIVKNIEDKPACLNRLFYDENYTGGSGFLIGNEGKGLTEEVSSMADGKIRIPMKGEVESMNAATSAAILTFEASRQRRG